MPFIVGYKLRGIQDYIAGGRRLVDIVAGSEMIDSLTRKRLADILRSLGLGGIDPSGNAQIDPMHGAVLQAGSGRILLLFHDGDSARRFTRLWPLLAEQWAPGARHAIALRETDEAGIAGAVQQVVDRVNSGPELAVMALPLGGPLTLRERRTGLPVVDLWPGEDGAWEDHDASSQRRARIRRDMRERIGELERRFGFAQEARPSRDTEAIARAGGGDILAVIHADGTAFGERFGQLSSQDAIADFSALLRDVFIAAATFALQPVMNLCTDAKDEGRIAARPIVLGGDDMTVVVPGRFGLEVATRFLQRVEQASAERMPGFLKKHPQKEAHRWQRVQAGAGIAYVHAHFPFSLALRLADTCAAWAKAQLKAAPGGLQWQTSCLHFHAALDSGSDEYGDIIAQQLQRRRDGAITHELTAGPYVISPVAGFARIDDLAVLRDVVDAMPRRGWREISRLVHETSDPLVDRRFHRQLGIMEGTQRDALRNALRPFGCTDSIWSSALFPSRPPPDASTSLKRTPVQDIDTLIGLQRKSDMALAAQEQADA